MLTEKENFLKCSLYFKVIYDVILGITENVTNDEEKYRKNGRLYVESNEKWQFSVTEMNYSVNGVYVLSGLRLYVRFSCSSTFFVLPPGTCRNSNLDQVTTASFQIIYSS